jgi:UDP:flavonoid glycosyltransferase YjiC (YdhE family)
MKIGIITYGTRGDVQPYIALALGLLDKGHQVTLAAPENFKEFVGLYGIDFHALHGNAEAILYSPEGLRVLKTGNAITLLRHIQRGGKKLMPFITKDILACCSEVDVIIASGLTMIWVDSIAEKLKKNWALFQLGPVTTPTREFPFIGFASLNNSLYNFISHKLFNFIYWKLNKKDINRFRASLGLTKLKKTIFDKITSDKILNLYGLSPQLVPRPKDWDSYIDITGFLTLPSNKVDLIPEDMNEWLQSGQSPIYIGFGSMPVPDPELFSRILNDIISTTELRIIFCKGWSVIPNLPNHPNLFVIKSVNHEWLFPKCRAVVFHGGIGTLATCLKAKTPLVVVSVFGDQPWNGKLIVNKKLGFHIPFKKLTSANLINALKSIQAVEIKHNVATIGEQIGKEKGLENALFGIENYFNARQKYGT